MDYENVLDSSAEKRIVTDALSSNDAERVRLLQADGLDITKLVYVNDKWNALHYVVVSPTLPTDPEFVRFLIEEGVDASAVDNNGSTPLHYAARGQRTEIVKLLLAAGAPVNTVNNDGRNAFILAAIDEPPSPECIEALLQAGAYQQSPEAIDWLRQNAQRLFDLPEYAFMLELIESYLPPQPV